MGGDARIPGRNLSADMPACLDHANQVEQGINVGFARDLHPFSERLGDPHRASPRNRRSIDQSIPARSSAPRGVPGRFVGCQRPTTAVVAAFVRQTDVKDGVFENSRPDND
jgi:hypothetical protein